MGKLKPDSAVPLYRQMMGCVRNWIESGELGAGDRIPSEARLGEDFGVSRITIRQSLAELEREGILERVPGKGTFVRERNAKVERLTRLSGFGENMASLGLRAGYRTLRAEEALAPMEAADRLSAPGRRAFVVERILLADDAAVGMHTSYLPLWLVRNSPLSFSRDSLDQGSLYSAFEAAGSVLRRAEETVEPAVLSADEADKVDAEKGDLALKIRRTVYDIEDRPVEYVIIIYRADSYTFRLELQA